MWLILVNFTSQHSNSYPFPTCQPRADGCAPALEAADAQFSEARVGKRNLLQQNWRSQDVAPGDKGADQQAVRWPLLHLSRWCKPLLFRGSNARRSQCSSQFPLLFSLSSPIGVRHYRLLNSKPTAHRGQIRKCPLTLVGRGMSLERLEKTEVYNSG